MSSSTVKCQEGLGFLSEVSSETVDLILTDPPYIISKDSGMDAHKKKIDSGTSGKTKKEWETFLASHKEIETTVKGAKTNFLKYGSPYGKKYAVATQYGEWDSDFTLEKLGVFIEQFYRVLKPGGTCIIFFDLWKIGDLKGLMESVKFKQIRLIEWIKTNPQPINSKVNYLTNCREIAVLGIKGAKPTFNSSYDKGIYEFPLQGGKDRFHPTQKSLLMFEEIIKKHSNEGDTVLDCFLGSGTTAVASLKQKRNFKGCEQNEEYVEKGKMILKRVRGEMGQESEAEESEAEWSDD